MFVFFCILLSLFVLSALFFGGAFFSPSRFSSPVIHFPLMPQSPSLTTHHALSSRTYSLLLSEAGLTGRGSCRGGLTRGLAIVDAAVRKEPSLAVLVLLFSFINDRYQSSASSLSRAEGRVHVASPLLHERSPVSPQGGAVIRKDRCMITSRNSCASKPN